MRSGRDGYAAGPAGSSQRDLGTRAVQRIATRLAAQASDDNVRSSDSPLQALPKLRETYPSASALLHELECPEFFRCLAGTSERKRILGDALSRWIALGRPEAAWPDDEDRPSGQGRGVVQ